MLCYWLLIDTGQEIARTTVQQLTYNDLLSPVAFDRIISDQLPTESLNDNNTSTMMEDICAQVSDELFDPMAAMPEQDECHDFDSYDQYITAEVLLPCGNTDEKGTVLCSKHDANGNLIWHANNNPILDTPMFE